MDLTQFDIKPEGMINYLRYNGPHFSEKLAEFAISKMRKDGTRLLKIEKESVDNLLKNANVLIENDYLYDTVYVANMAKADYFGSSITNDILMAKFIKDYLDDEDGYDGIAFNRFLADCARKGIVINWKDIL